MPLVVSALLRFYGDVECTKSRVRIEHIADQHEFIGLGGLRQRLEALAQATQADEFMLVCDVFDADSRLRALDIAVEAKQGADH